jgi:hypothetical protein
VGRDSHWASPAPKRWVTLTLAVAAVQVITSLANAQVRCPAEILGAQQGALAFVNRVADAFLLRIDVSDPANLVGDYQGMAFSDFDRDYNGQFELLDVNLVVRQYIHDVGDFDRDSLLGFIEFECRRAGVAAGLGANAVRLDPAYDQTIPGVPDQNTDCDGDGVSNAIELATGRDPLRPGDGAGLCECQNNDQCLPVAQACVDGVCMPNCPAGAEGCVCLDGNAPCQDGLQCIGGSCRLGGCRRTLDCALAGETRGQICIEADCIDCTSNHHCVRSSAYGSGSTCIEGRCRTDAAPCDPNADLCACSQAVDCQARPVSHNWLCIDDQCIPCTGPDQCDRVGLYGFGARCIEGQCRPWEPPCAVDDPGCACNFGNDCNGRVATQGFLCLEGECRTCLNGSMCESVRGPDGQSLYGAGAICEAGRCKSADLCNSAFESCACETARQCNQALEIGGICIEGACVDCRNNTDCSRAAFYGDGALCVNGRCERPEGCVGTGGACPCRTTVDCTDDPAKVGFLCIEGECQACGDHGSISGNLLCQAAGYGDGASCTNGRCEAEQ